jgi:cell division protein FtsB
VGALIALAGELRAANVSLRQQVATLQSENRQLSERIAAASNRVEGLLRKLPATTE